MKKQMNRLLSLLLSLVMVLGMLPMTAPHAHASEIPIAVTTQGNVYSLFTEENLEDQYGTTFLYVIERDGRYYTPAHPRVSVFAEVDSVAAVDITEYWDAQTNTFSGIPDSADVGVMQYQSYTLPEYGASALFLEGNVMLSLSVPFEDGGETWFDGGIRYYDRYDTYSYSRALWEANGDGSGYFYDRYTDWYGDSATVFGVLALNSNNRFALRNFSEAFAEEENIDVNGYLYAAPCSHDVLDHSAYDAPTCMDKGCDEYWYCVLCDSYYADEACRNELSHKPVLPALDHNYGDKGCSNCGQPIPVYTRITSYEQFKTVDPNASFIAVAEIDDGNGGKEYYVMKKEISAPDADIDENGSPDILQVDEDSNGVADVLEIDADSDGVADAMAYDGFYSGEPDGVLDDEEIWEYIFALENDYTDGYIPGLHTIGIIPVTPDKDGTISVMGLGALEWIMERKISDDELDDQYYGDGITVKDYENDFYFRIPNFWIRPVVTISNNYYQMPYEQGDSKWWGVLFGADVAELQLDEEFRTLPVTHPDDAVLLYTETFFGVNFEGEVEHSLRFLINGEEKNFIMTSTYFWEELEGTQYPIYLYCSDPGGEVHEHVFGDWTSVTEENHKRTCTVDGCSEYEVASHTPGAECTPDPENYELGHWVTCTECGGQFHEYHTREEAGRYYPNYWRDTGDGIHHVVNCTKCLGPVEYAEHDWSDWYNGNKEIDGEWVRGHYRRCEKFPCEANEWQAECIYDEGVVTTAPTCLETGVMTYTCMADPACELDTKTYTEEIPALDHDWGEWLPMDGDPTREQRVCKRDPNHTEEREVIVHEHVWGDWTPVDVENHKRTCSADGCDLPSNSETAAHDWNDGVQTAEPTCTEPGEITYTCATCGQTKAAPVDALDHDWDEWTYDSVDSHIRHCKRENCEAEDYGGHEWGDWVKVDDNTHEMSCDICGGAQTGEHDWDNGEITAEPSCEDKGEKTYTCQTCSCTRTEEIDATGHRYESTVIQAPTCMVVGLMTETCAACADTREREMPVDPLAHDWGEWTTLQRPGVNANGEEKRVCRHNSEHIEVRDLKPIPCWHICAACGGCTDENCPGDPKCTCVSAPETLGFVSLDDTAISFVPNQPMDLPDGQTVSIVANEVILPSASDSAASQPAAAVNPYEEFILNNAEGMKVETVFEIGLVDQTGAAYELDEGESVQVRLFVGPEHAQAIEAGRMFLVHITNGTRVTYGAEEIIAELDGNTYTGYITFSTDSFSPFVLVSLPEELDITVDGKGAINSCTVSIHANQAYRCNLIVAAYDADGRVLAMEMVDSCNLAANPQYTLNFSGTASYVKAFMMAIDGSLALKAEVKTDPNLAN